MIKKTFDRIDFALNPLAIGEYENIAFKNSFFLRSSLADIIFVDCNFEHCDMSMAKLTNTTLRDVKFANCKMLGLRFDTCNEFGLSATFENCNLSHSSFYGTKLRKTAFVNLKLHEVDFAGCDLGGSVFTNCDFAGASFDNAILEKTDFRTSFNYSIDPERNKIKKARFSVAGIAGLLDKYDIEISN